MSKSTQAKLFSNADPEYREDSRLPRRSRSGKSNISDHQKLIDSQTSDASTPSKHAKSNAAETLMSSAVSGRSASTTTTGVSGSATSASSSPLRVPIDSASHPKHHKDLWERAYDLLFQNADNTKLLETYKALVSAELNDDYESTASSGKGNVPSRKDQFTSLVDRKLKEVDSKRGKLSKLLGKQVDRGVKLILFAKDFISAAAELDAHVALAWTGVSLFLPLLLNPSSQTEDLGHGLDYITSLIRQYHLIEELHGIDAETVSKTPKNASERSQGRLAEAIIQVYAKILKYQASVLCVLSTNRVVRYMKNVVRSSNWKSLLEEIKTQEAECSKFLSLHDQQTVASERTHQESRMEEMFQEHVQMLTGIGQTLKENQDEQREWHQSDLERRCHEAFRTSDYQTYKNQNPERLDRTCEWFLNHPHYHHWRDSKHNDLLWVSAEPGTGKSVLARFLVDHELKKTHDLRVLYFFFKDVSDHQRSASGALSALLHQLFIYEPRLIKHAIAKFEQNGKKITELLYEQWEVLEASLTDPAAKSVVCVIDALDECSEAARYTFIEHLKKFHKGGQQMQKKSPAKILITSRPYSAIQQKFADLVSDMPTIRLAGEQETKTISHEIDLVIKSQVKAISKELDLTETISQYLEVKLLGMQNRTYLWLQLIWKVIRREQPDTKMDIKAMIRSLPDGLDATYEALLNQCTSHRLARQILHMVVAATRPLTVDELNTALAVRDAETTYSALERRERQSFMTKLPGWCGFLVHVVDSQVLLCHQTVKPFLLSHQRPLTERAWMHSFRIDESHSMLAETCIKYMSMKDFERDPLKISDRILWRHRAWMEKYCAKRDFLRYSAINWSVHFRSATIDDQCKMSNKAQRFCQPDKIIFQTWFPLYWLYSVLIASNQNAGSMPILTELMVASNLGLEYVVEKILATGRLVGETNRIGRTALHYAAINPGPATVRVLLTHGANADLQDDAGVTPLHEAINHGNHEVLSCMIEHGAEVNKSSQKPSIGTPLEAALRCGNVEAVLILLRHGVDATIKNDEGNTILHMAARAGFTDVVRYLLETEASIEARNRRGETATWLAAEHGSCASLREILSAGANVNAKNWNGETVLCLRNLGEDIIELLIRYGAKTDDLANRVHMFMNALDNGKEQIINALIQSRCGISTKDEYGVVSLHVAAQYGRQDLVKRLIEAGVDVNTMTKAGRNALHIASLHGHEDVVTELLTSRIAVNGPAGSRSTPLHIAVAMGRFKISSLLIGSGTHLNVQDEKGKTPLHIAAMKGDYRICSLLIEAKAAVDLQDVKGDTPLHSAARLSGAVVQLLVEAGARPNANNYAEEAPLHLAVRSICYASVVALIRAGTNLNHQDKRGETPLHAACRSSHTMPRTLLDAGAKVDEHDNRGRTPLHLAVAYKDQVNVQYLLDHSADIEVKDIAGNTPLAISVEKGDIEMATLLVSRGANMREIKSVYSGFKSVFSAFESPFRGEDNVYDDGPPEAGREETTWETRRRDFRIRRKFLKRALTVRLLDLDERYRDPGPVPRLLDPPWTSDSEKSDDFGELDPSDDGKDSCPDDRAQQDHLNWRRINLWMWHEKKLRKLEHEYADLRGEECSRSDTTESDKDSMTEIERQHGDLEDDDDSDNNLESDTLPSRSWSHHRPAIESRLKHSDFVNDEAEKLPTRSHGRQRPDARPKHTPWNLIVLDKEYG